MNTCFPATIVSFNEDEQTATVRLVIEKFFSDLDANYIPEPIADIVDVPCHFPTGGGHSITMPVEEGDNCLVFFAQKGIDHWLYDNAHTAGSLRGKPSPQHIRQNSLTDALALIGFGSGILEKSKVIKDFNPKAIEIRNRDRTQRISLLVESKKIEVVTGDDLHATVSGTTTIVCPKIILDGDLQVTGNADFGGYIKGADKVNLVRHKHKYQVPEHSKGMANVEVPN